MKSTEKIRLTSNEWLTYYRPSLVFLGFGLVPTYFAIISGEASLIFVASVLLGLSGLFYWRSRQQLFFHEYRATMTDERFRRAVTVTAGELDWKIITLEKNYAEALRYAETFGIGGSQRIIIKRSSDRLRFNSMANLKMPKPGSLSKRNKENLNVFLRNAAGLLRGEDVELIALERQQQAEEQFWEQSEWTVGGILRRLIGYGLTLLFLLVGALFIYEGEWRGLFFIDISLFFAFACHPGSSRTSLIDTSGSFMMRMIFNLMKLSPLTQSAEKGAYPMLMCATAPDLDQSAFYGPTGRNNWVGPVGTHPIKPHAKDKAVAKRLWEVSEAVTGCNWNL